jgi:hypothetical protein
METLKDVLWPIVAIGGLGTFIDFLIGRRGQEKARDWFLKWWVRFDDVHWKNFGREEGLFAGRLIQCWFGKRFWSPRRLLAFVVMFILTYLTFFIRTFLDSEISPICSYCDLGLKYTVVSFTILLAGFTTSISFTRLLAFQIAHLCGTGRVRNMTIFTLMLLINYLLLLIWFPITSGTKENFVEGIFSSNPDVLTTFDIASLSILQEIRILKDVLKNVWGNFYPTPLVTLVYKLRQIEHASYVEEDASFIVALFPALFRFVLSIIFVGSFLLRPLIMRPVSLVWARIIESEKPVFTLIFGGAAAFATAISEAAKHL